MPIAEFQPVDRRSTAEMIADRLRAAIMNGALRPGTQLVEAELAAQFDVSRGPVREAMQRLVSEGLAYSMRHRGIFVIELTLDDVLDIYRARAAIEGGALDLILDNGRSAAAVALAPVVADMRAAAARGDAAGVSDADHAFHKALVACCGSLRLMRAADTLLIETRMCIGALESTYADLAEQVTEHETLRAAISDGPADHARALLAEHMEDAIARLRTRF
ncbi:GntR family transcriptional regulator [Nocardia sp. NBC_01503]|uniref:GntR family transcriptional regulator n=1 Tax=Nocardia sp. NBC_01503 TaxID=2975997 RepID=UPI002E7BC1C3|nr:GntR family transcriptional regulator [Nocardia sp. NBC_01503]WTL33417.1 GntR family transcriptional regulator [Nocardia sp. NBC_01503]